MKFMLSLIFLVGACAQDRDDGSVMSRSAVEKSLTSFFRSHDENHDGDLSSAEYSLGLSKADNERASLSVEVERDFSASDTNHDGKLSWSEFSLPRFEWFNCLDSNKDAVIDREELRKGPSICSDAGLSTETLSNQSLHQEIHRE